MPFTKDPNTRGQTDRQAQSIKFKQGKIKCCKERNITAPPNEWRNIPLSTIGSTIPSFQGATWKSTFILSSDIY